jgi:hypothetical protein
MSGTLSTYCYERRNIARAEVSTPVGLPWWNKRENIIKISMSDTSRFYTDVQMDISRATTTMFRMVGKMRVKLPRGSLLL